MGLVWIPDFSSQSWGKSVVKLCTDSSKSYAFEYLARAQKSEYFVHELGHSFGLSHPNHSITCIMQAYGSCGQNTPMPHDEACLNAKY